MKRLGVVAIVSALAACGGSDNENCDFSKETGTYKLHWTERSGTCGDLPDSLVSFDAGGGGVASSCVFQSDNEDESTCKIEKVFTCDDTADGFRFSYISTITMTADDGSELSGSIQVGAAYLSTGQTICSGLYDVKYTRQ